MVEGKVLVLAACAAALTATACNNNSLPGTPLGTYNVTGTLGTNTCGSGLGAPSPWTFTTQLSEDTSTTPTTLYWLSSDGTELSNTMSSATSVNISQVVTTSPDAIPPLADAAPDSAAGMGTLGMCTLQQSTTLALTLANGMPPVTFSGTITYTFESATGVSSASNCTDQLSSNGGTYDTLPCTASYSLSASHQ
jgi:hypothetical protein